MANVGVVVLPYLPPERLRAVVTTADESGVDEIWLWEDCFLTGGVSVAAAALAWTERVTVGVGVLPVPLRNVASTAMELAGLHRMFPGRVRAAVGHGVQDWMGQVGARAASPLTLLREYTTALRALLAGQTVTAAGRYVRLDGVALDWPPPTAVPVLAGATGPRTLTLTGEVADGTVLTGGTCPERVRAARERIAEGRRAAGRDGDHQVVAYVHAATGPDVARLLEAERVRWGYDSMADLAVHGDADAVAAGVGRWHVAGVDTVVLQPPADDPDPEGFMRFVGGQVTPIVRGVA